MSIQQLIDDIKADGLQVFGPEKLTSYVYFTDGTRIGYVQYDPMSGEKFSTVNKPCKQCGTGYRVDTAQQALVIIPSWANSADRSMVRKYKDFEEFKKNNWQPLVQY